MTGLKLRAMSRCGRLAAAVSVLLALGATAIFGQGRGFHGRPMVMPSMMRSPTPAMTPAMMMQSQMASTMATIPASRAQLITNALLRRDVRLDSFLARRDLGNNPWWGRSSSQWGGMGGGGTWGSGGSLLLGGGGTVPTAAQTSPATTEDTARAALLLEQAVAERLANRRRAFDETEYERDKTPTPEQQLLNRSRGNPAPADVRSGQALNALLTDLRRHGAGTDEANRPNTLLPLDRAGLRHINVTRGAGDISLLKNRGNLNWPDALANPASREPRDRLSSQVAEVVRQEGRVDPAVLREMADDVAQLRTLLRQDKGQSFGSFIEARNFLDRFDDALVALGQPDAANYFNGTYSLTAQTTLGLVKQMSDAGLRFAPAGPGDDFAYKTLWEALAAYDRAIAQPQAAAR